MTTVQTTCPEAAYLSKDNIVVPSTVSAAQLAAAEARARAELAQRTGFTVTGGSIRQGKQMWPIYTGDGVPKAFVNAPAATVDTAVVAAVPGRKIRVHQVANVAGGTATNVTFNSKPVGAGSAISPLFADGVNGGAVLPFSAVGWFDTNAGEGLSVTTAAGSAVGILVAYTLVSQMSIVAADVQQQLSGGAANATPSASLGGIISATALADNVKNNLFADVTTAEAASGLVDHFGIYIKNNHGTLPLTDARVYISVPTTSADTELDIAVAAEAMNVTMATIAARTTVPTGVTFSRPSTYATGLALNSTTGLTVGSWRGVWVRRTVNASAAAITADAGTIKAEGGTT